MKNIVWRDYHIKRYLIILFISTFIVYGLFVIHPTLDAFLSRTMVLPLIPLLLLLLILRIRLTYVSEDGIRIGNARNGEYYSIKLNTPKFVEWNDIKTIKIYNKGIKYPLSLNYENFLLITTKDNRTYDSFIAQPKGFLKTLKDLKKEKLISKDSKYLEIIKEK